MGLLILGPEVLFVYINSSVVAESIPAINKKINTLLSTNIMPMSIWKVVFTKGYQSIAKCLTNILSGTHN